jgi:Sec-independent protein secretion pathway component TatC
MLCFINPDTFIPPRLISGTKIKLYSSPMLHLFLLFICYLFCYLGIVPKFIFFFIEFGGKTKQTVKIAHAFTFITLWFVCRSVRV